MRYVLPSFQQMLDHVIHSTYPQCHFGLLCHLSKNKEMLEEMSLLPAENARQTRSFLIKGSRGFEAMTNCISVYKKDLNCYP